MMLLVPGLYEHEMDTEFSGYSALPAHRSIVSRHKLRAGRASTKRQDTLKAHDSTHPHHIQIHEIMYLWGCSIFLLP